MQFKAGSKNPRAKLHGAKLRRWVLRQIAAGVPKTVLAKKLKIGPRALWDLEHGRSYKSTRKES